MSDAPADTTTEAPGSSEVLVDQRTPGRRVVVDLDAGSLLVLALVALAATAVWAVARIAPDMLTRLAVGVVLGVALSPLVVALQKRFSVPRSVAAAVVGGGMIVAFAVVALVIAPPAIRQARTFSSELPSTIRELYSWPVVGERLADAEAPEQVTQWIDELPARIDDATLANLGERLLGGALSTVVVLVMALGVLFDGDTIVRRARALVPTRSRARVDGVSRIVYHSFGSYFAGSVLVAVLNGLVILSTGLVLGVPLAPVAGLWATLTNLIPQIGGFLGGSFFVVLALTEGPLTAIIAGAIFVLYQQFENNVLAPAIVGSAVNLTPPATMLAALVGGAAAGVPGALVATPLLGAAKALYLDRKGELPSLESRSSPVAGLRDKASSLLAKLRRSS